MAKLSDEELLARYGLTASLVYSSSELASLFNRAVAESWSGARFQASLKNTNWWKTQSSTLRQWMTLRYTDPATWRQKWQAAVYQVNRLAVQVGLSSRLSSGSTYNHMNGLLQQAAYRLSALGWTEERVKDWLGQSVSLTGGDFGGEAREAFDQLHELAYLNGMKYSTSWYEQRARRIVSGRATAQQYEAEIRRQAAARYSAYAEQIRAGQNVMDLAAPYIKSVAQILELNEGDVDLSNRYVSKAMTAKPAKGQQAGSQMPLWQFENELRNDPLWRKTNNAREGMFGVARQVLKDFGMGY